jgi:hypothetical protein
VFLLVLIDCGGVAKAAGCSLYEGDHTLVSG